MGRARSVGLGAVGGDAKESEVEHAFDFLTNLFTVALGVEFGIDVGAFGPIPEDFFEIGIGMFFHEGEAFLFEEDALGMEITAAESDDGFAEFVEVAELGFGVFVGWGHGVGEGSEANGNPISEAFGHGGGE